MRNADIAKIFYEIGEYLEMDSVPFKPRAYEKVAETIEGLSTDVAAIYKSGGVKALKEIPGVGVSTAEKIEELLKTGKVKEHEELKKKTPVNLSELRRVEGLGPKKIKVLYQKLGVRNLEDLAQAVKSGKIRKLAGFGEKSEGNIKKGLEFIDNSGGRAIMANLIPLVDSLRARLQNFPGVKTAVVAGSFRRCKDTVGDIDILVTAKKSKPVMDYFVELPEVARVIAQGDTKCSVKLDMGLNVDVRVVPEESYGAALNYFTGSKDHNVVLRQKAIDMGFKLNEYGLWRGKKMVAGRTEEDIYKALKLNYIEPELRENTGEIELAAKGKPPKIIEYADVIGDLQNQTDWSDGADTITDMAKAAMALGRKYIAITDHTKSLRVANGLDVKRLREQMKEIDGLNLKFKISNLKFKILKGTECDILKDGSLDLPDEILKDLDVVGISVHSHFNLSREEQTKRVKRAMSNPHADILFHPTGRLINKREGYDIDIDEVIRHAKKTGTVMEINAFPERSDLSAENIRKCVDMGVKMSIDSDSHMTGHMIFIDSGISQARRGWCKKTDIINAWSVDKMLEMLKK